MPDLETQFAARGPWITCFNLNGRNFGGNYGAEGDHRLRQFLDIASNPGRVLELGCLEGGHSLTLANYATQVVAIDSRESNLEKARWVQTLKGISNVEFVQANLEETQFESFGGFDWVFNVGLLYHLPEPWKLLQKLALCGQRMFLWTHVCNSSSAKHSYGGYQGELYREHGHSDPLSGMSGESFWPSYEELRRMLGETGFDEIELLSEEQGHEHGPAVTLVCRSTRYAQNGPPADVGTQFATQ